nr:alcohol dehydrogenase catalytic domain-containing protein [Angustibacter aerolatus]
MRAVRYDAVGQLPRLTDVPEPVCPDGGVVVRVGATGVCRSDWHAWRGHDPVALPHVPGHELAGTVAEVGAGVRGWRVGDRVTVPFVCGCGACPTCAAGDQQVCPHQTQPGFTGPGAFADLVALHAADTNLVGLPDGLDDVTAAALGCRFATAFRALTAHGGLRAGQWLAVHGCGGAGLSAVMIGVALGARVVAVDVSPVALDAAHRLGADALVDASSGTPVAEAVREPTGGEHTCRSTAPATRTSPWPRCAGCAAEAGTCRSACCWARGRPRRCPWTSSSRTSLSVHGSHGMAAHEYPAMLAMVADGRLDPARLVGSVVPLGEAGAALAALDDAPAHAGLTVVDLRLP